ncbi:hypothetical protein DFH29DRAFT_883308 [Suillus ampliporus]|nr:hypothetical protein DFH29DRAFT_883308 [Suillus ampliporus]
MIPRVIATIEGRASIALLSVGLLSQGFELPKMQSKRQSKKNHLFHADLDPVTPNTGVATLDSPNSHYSIRLLKSTILSSQWTMVRHWQKDWESEDMWNVMYEEVLTHTQAKREQETTGFLDACRKHAWDGRILLDSIRDLVHTHCLCCRERLKHDTILLYDLLVFITSQVKFFEVKFVTSYVYAHKLK